MILSSVVKRMPWTERSKILCLSEELTSIIVLISFQSSSFLKVSFWLAIRSKSLLFSYLFLVRSLVSFPLGKSVEWTLWLRLKIIILSKFLSWIVKSLRCFECWKLCFKIYYDRLRMSIRIHEKVLSLYKLSVLNDHLCILIQIKEILIVSNLILGKRVL